MRKIVICILVLILCGSFICCTYASEKLFDNKYDALKVDPIEEYWMVVFTFGSGGESEIPYLLQYIHDENRNIRFNSLVMLGNWLLAYDCKEQLVDLYWKESDQEIKLLILSNLERLITNLRESKEFFSLVAKNEPDKKVREFARESVDLITEFSGTMEKLRKEKEIDQKKFENEYRVLNDSYGTEGDYIKLLKYSSLENENELRKLRVRILERNSDEALYDYKKINDIIGFNWLLNDN